MSSITKENLMISSVDMQYPECPVQLMCQSYLVAEMTEAFFSTPSNGKHKKLALTAHVPIWLVLTMTYV